MTLLHPGWLVLLLVALLPWALRPVRDRRHALVRSVVFVFLALGLARPVSVSSSGPEHHAIVLDLSASAQRGIRASLPTTVESAVADVLAALPRDARTTLVVAGDTDVGGADDVSRVPATAGSPLGAMLAAAERGIPLGAAGAITLITDGLGTHGDHERIVARLAARGIPVHVTRLSGPGQYLLGSVPVSMRARGTWRVGQTAQLDVVVNGSDAVEAVLTGPSGDLARVAVPMPQAQGVTRRAAELEFEPSAAGPLELTVTCNGTSLTQTFAVQPPFRVLHVGARVQDAGPTLARLVGPGFDVEEAGADLPSPDSYDLVIVDDRAAETVPGAWQQAIRSAVIDRGVGLVMAGGGDAFGPGGWHDTTLAEVLPVESAQKEEKRDPSTTLAIIIDTSGSMSGGRVQLAKEVARLAIRRLLPHDKVGIVEFYGAKRWAAPIQPASNAIELQRALNRLNAGGGTVILPAIEEAYYGMQNVQTRFKHVLVLTDGGVERGAFEPLIRKMTEEGMNVSTVLIGSDAHSEFLVSIANWGKGRFYAVPNRFNLPEVILKQPTTARLPAYRPGSHPVLARGGRGWWGPVDPESAPPLSGYVETRVRDGAQVVLETEAASHPIVATWRYGLGRVTALTTEPVGPGTRGWMDWDGYGAFLARVLERTAREPDLPVAYGIRSDGPHAVVTAVAQIPAASGADLAGEASLDEHADGRFRATLPAWGSAPMVVEGRRDDARAVTLVADRRSVVSPEGQVDPARAVDLAAVAAATGGDVIAIETLAAFRPSVGDGSAQRDVTEWRPLLLILALLAYVGDVLYRRLPGRPSA